MNGEEVAHFVTRKSDNRVVRIDPAPDPAMPVRWFFEPGMVDDAPYRVAVDGETFPLAVAGYIVPAYYARFQLHRPIELEIAIDLPEAYQLNLQPARYRDDLSGGNGTWHLRIEQPGPRVIKLESSDGSRRLPLMILPEEPKSWVIPDSGDHFIDLSAHADAAELLTGEIQQALDSVAASEFGGVVYFGPGTYRTRQLVVGPNTRVFLAPGALIQADHDYQGRQRPLVLFNRAHGSGLDGPGVIDGQGHIIRGDAPGRAPASFHLVRFLNSKDVYANDTVLRDSSAWTLHISGCDDVKVDSVRLFADWGVRHTDGIDPDNVRNVDISGVFVMAGDDALCVKTSDRYGTDPRTTRNVTMRDSVVMSLKTPLKIGTESVADIENVVFENIDVIHSARGIGLWKRDGARFSNITFRSIRIDALEYEGESMSGEPIRFVIQDRVPGGVMENIVVENVEISAPYRAIFSGRESGRFDNVVLRDIRWTVTPARIKQAPEPVTLGWVTDRQNELPIEGRPLVTVHRVRNLLVEDMLIDWSLAKDDWDRFLDIQQSESIDWSGVEHHAYPFR